MVTLSWANPQAMNAELILKNIFFTVKNLTFKYCFVVFLVCKPPKTLE